MTALLSGAGKITESVSDPGALAPSLPFAHIHVSAATVELTFLTSLEK
jgi:hypothetical protein